MQSVIDLVNSIKDTSVARHSMVINKLGITENDQPAGAFGMCHNYAILTLELLHAYKNVWTRASVANVDIERTRQENGERVILITKSLFIHCMSSIEYGAKETLTSHPSLLPLGNSRIYLRRIMELSNMHSLITAEEKALWIGAVEVRNCLTHNNGIADCTMACSFPDLTVQMSDGKMVRGTLDFFPRLTQWAIDAFGQWVLAIFEAST